MKIIQKAIIQKNNKYLILLRSQNAPYFPEHWDFPGGKLEDGEDPFDGIRREVLEETNFIVEPIKVEGVYELDLDNKGENTHRFVVYSSNLISEDFNLSYEHIDYKWATKEEILQLKIEPYLKLFLEEYTA